MTQSATISQGFAFFAAFPPMILLLYVLLFMDTISAPEPHGPHCLMLGDREIRLTKHGSFRCKFSIDCRVDKWRQRSKPSHLIILTYGHNGFGNQLFQYTFGYLMAKSLKATFYADTIALNYTPANMLPHNTGGGSALIDRILPHEFKYYLLPQDHEHRKLCDAEPEALGDRPHDHRMWIDDDYKKKYSKYFTDLFTDSKPRCLKIVGFFQTLPYCFDSVKVNIC